MILNDIFGELNEAFLQVRAKDQSGTGDNSPAVASIVAAMPLVSASQAKVAANPLSNYGPPNPKPQTMYVCLKVY